MKVKIIITFLMLFSAYCIADENTKNEFLKDGFSVAQQSCQNQADFDYLAANSALSEGFRDQAVVVAKRMLKSIGADPNGANELADRRIDYFNKNISLAKLITMPGMTGERYQECIEQSIHDLNKAASTIK